VHLTNAVTYTVVPRLAFVSAARRARTASEIMMLAVAPQGGQRTARRNALTSVRADTVAARERADMLAAIIAAQPPALDPGREHAAS
jgi:hypothetical protein